MRKYCVLICFLFFALCYMSADEVICKVLKDNSIATYHSSKESELTENVGSSKQLKIKGNENYLIFKFDFSNVPKGSSIEKAELVVEVTDPSFRLRQIGFSSIPMDWEEGRGSSGDNKDHKFACMLGSHGPSSGWGRPDFRFINVISGNAGNVNGVVLAENIGDNKFKMELPGRLVEAMMIDQAGGLCIIDESGWWDQGKRKNIYIFSKEGKKEAELKVFIKKEKDTVKPSAPKVSQVINQETLDGDALLEFVCGGDDGDKGIALGYDIRFSEGTEIDWEKAEKLNRIYIPRPQEAGKKFKYLFRNLQPGKTYTFGVQAYDEAGNLSDVVKVPVKVLDTLKIETPNLEKFAIEKGGALSNAKIKVWAIDELTKINPVKKGVFSGLEYIEDTLETGNYFWNGKNKKVKLTGGRGEYVSFRLVIENTTNDPIKAITIAPAEYTGGGETISVENVRLLREWYLKVGEEWFGEAMPELMKKNNGVLSLPDDANNVSGQKRQVVFVETFVPYKAKTATYVSNFKIMADGEELVLPIELSVLDYEIPRELNFVVELNAYGARNKENFHAVHRLAHIYRTGYNVLEYGHSGSESVPFVPKVEGLGDQAKVTDWSQWDEYMGPILSGELFKDLPRGAVPIPHFYMPFYENYPMPVTEYLDNKIHSQREPLSAQEYTFFMCENDVLVWDGFSENWKKGVQKIGKEYREHFESKGWTKTQFQLFLNNKVFKGGKNATSLWTLDEPTFGRDFRALGHIYREFKKPFVGSKLDMVTRADISRPSLQGDKVDDAVDYNVVSSAFYVDRDPIERRLFEKDEKYWVYGGAGNNAADYDLSHLSGVFLRYWILGADGGLPYWTSFSGGTWDESKPLAIVLKAEKGYSAGPVASSRLVAKRRSQQDVEMMILLSKKNGWSRKKVAQLVNTMVNLEATNASANPDDPGSLTFGKLRAENIARLRIVLQEEILKK